MNKKRSGAASCDSQPGSLTRSRRAVGTGSRADFEDCALDIISALAKEIPVRDIRAVAVLLILARDHVRSIPSRSGVSVDFLAEYLDENAEAIRHIVRNLEIAGLATCCGRLLRTRLYTATDRARLLLHACGVLARGDQGDEGLSHGNRDELRG